VEPTAEPLTSSVRVPNLRAWLEKLSNQCLLEYLSSKADFDHPHSTHEINVTVFPWNVSIEKILDNHQESKKQRKSEV
jgi:hypothetical protein